MGKTEKFLEEIFKLPYSKNIEFRKAARFLIAIGCRKPKNSGGSHRTFVHPNQPRYVVGLVDNENLKKYQIDEMRALITALGIYSPEE